MNNWFIKLAKNVGIPSYTTLNKMLSNNQAQITNNGMNESNIFSTVINVNFYCISQSKDLIFLKKKSVGRNRVWLSNGVLAGPV